MKLKPTCKDYLWSGNRLIKEYSKELDSARLAEIWKLTVIPVAPPSSPPARMPD